MVAGPQGAGKSTEAAKYVARGFERLNRDELGGTLAGLHRELDRRLRRGGRFVVDNTYLARADRHPVVELAARHRTPVRLVFCEAPSELLQARIARRMVESLGYLPGPDGLRALAKQHPFVFTPSVHFRALRALELADPAEGFESIEVARAQLPTPGAESGSGLESVAILWDTLVGRPTILDALLGRVSNLFVFAWCLPEDLQVVSRELGRLQERRDWALPTWRGSTDLLVSAPDAWAPGGVGLRAGSRSDAGLGDWPWASPSRPRPRGRRALRLSRGLARAPEARISPSGGCLDVEL
jgi:hypothetical protein